MGKQEKQRKQKNIQQITPRHPIQRQSMFEQMRGEASSLALDHLQIERRSYAERWTSTNAAKFEADGHYLWMADAINGYERVLEIGPGDGRGTLALLNTGHTVIGVDENPEILKLAEARLQKAGKEVLLEAREKGKLSRRGYELRYSFPSQSFVAGGALLLVGDIQNDPKLLKWLTTCEPFDAITCWLIGTHEARTYNEVFDTINLGNVLEYRLGVQKQVYELASQVLRPGGILQIVDRGEPIENEQVRRDYEVSYRALATGTSLVVTDCRGRLYEEATPGSGIKMMPTSTKPGLILNLPRLSLTSIISQKADIIL